jgi:hypothetical protein
MALFKFCLVFHLVCLMYEIIYFLLSLSLSQVNRSTASNALDQIVNIVFQRMEAVDLREGDAPKDKKGATHT